MLCELMLHAVNAELLATKLPANACCMLCRLVTSHSAMEHYLVNLRHHVCMTLWKAQYKWWHFQLQRLWP